MTRPGRDAAYWLLAGAVRLLPAERGDWGRAMRAELAGIEPGQARWRFAAGCARAVSTQPAVLRGMGYPLLVSGVLIAGYEWTSGIVNAPLRRSLLALMVLLVVVSWLGRRRGVLGPVGAGRTARLVRVGGYLLVGVFALGTAVFMASAGNPDEKASAEVPGIAVMLSAYLLGFLTMTARRSAATARVLATGAGAGVGAVAVWMMTVLIAPPMPASVGWALALIVIAMGGTAFANAGRRGEPAGGVLAALFAGTVAALLLVILVAVLGGYGPASLIPDLAPAALTPAADAAQSRIEIVDPYIAVLLLGGLLAVVLSIVAIGTRTRLDHSETAGHRSL